MHLRNRVRKRKSILTAGLLKDWFKRESRQEVPVGTKGDPYKPLVLVGLAIRLPTSSLSWKSFSKRRLSKGSYSHCRLHPIPKRRPTAHQSITQVPLYPPSSYPTIPSSARQPESVGDLSMHQAAIQ